MKKAYSYVRFSTPEQMKGDSLRRQTEATEAYCRANGLTIDASLRLRDLGVSAFRGKNKTAGAFGAFIKAIESGRVKSGDTLIVENLDRMSREEVMTQLELFLSIIRHGVDIVTLMDGRRFNADAINRNPFDLMYSISTMARAHEESKTKSYRLSKAWEKKLDKVVDDHQPFSARCPAWMRLNKDTKKFELIPERVAIVRRIVQMATDGMGHLKIAAKFNHEKVPAFNRGKVKVWSTSTMRHLLTTKATIGELLLATGKIIPNYYPAILTEQEFYAMRSALTERRRRQYGRRDRYVLNLFGKTLTNGFDGSAMTLRRSPAGHRMISIEALRGGSWASYDYGTFERHFLKWVSEVTLVYEKPHDRSEEIKGRLAEIRSRIPKVKKALTGEGFTDELIDVLKNLTAQAADLEKKLEHELESAAPKSNPKDVKSLMAELAAAKEGEAEEVRLRLRRNISQLVTKVQVFIASAAGMKPRLLIAAVDMVDGSRRLFTVLAQAKKPTFSMGTKPLKPGEFNPEKIKVLIQYRGVKGLEQLPRMLRLPWDRFETPVKSG